MADGDLSGMAAQADLAPGALAEATLKVASPCGTEEAGCSITEAALLAATGFSQILSVTGRVSAAGKFVTVATAGEAGAYDVALQRLPTAPLEAIADPDPEDGVIQVTGIK